VSRIWIYEADVIRPVDGDTTVVDIDQGMNHWSRSQYIRFAGINAPEVHGPTKPAGDAATAYLMGLIPVGSKVWLATVEYDEFEKYGRVLAVVYTQPPAQLAWADATLADLMAGSVNQAMIDSGHAVAYNP
jgi:endonuclease YncB( thermonuclease family)